VPVDTVSELAPSATRQVLINRQRIDVADAAAIQIAGSGYPADLFD
jgi:hypothetical protein